LKTIESWAFDACENLRLVICEGAVPADLSNNKYAFSRVPVKEATLKVPGKGLNAYRVAPVWKDFFKIEAYDGVYLTDGEEFNNSEDLEDISFVSYTRNFSEKTAGNWQCLYVPFDITVTDELLEECDLAKLYMASYKDANGDGIIADDEPLAIVIGKVTSGKVIRGNTPVLIKAHNAGELVIEQEEVTLHKSESVSLSCSTMEENFIFTGVYSPVNINGFYTLGTNGQLSLFTQNTNLKPNRWYLEVKSRNGGEALVNRRIEILVDGEDDTTGIIDIDSESSTLFHQSSTIFTLDGRKVSDADKLPRGIYIINGKKQYVK